MRFKKVYIEITNHCNLNCSFCSKEDRYKREMTLEEFEHILKEIKKVTKYVYLHVKGEPLLHSKFKDILELCKKYEMIVNITTNGMLLNKQQDIIVNSNVVRQINISLNSSEGIENKDYYAEIVANATNNILKSSNIIVVYRFWALNNKNLNENNIALLNKILTLIHVEKINLNDNPKRDIKIKDNLYLSLFDKFNWPSLTEEKISEVGTCHGLKTHIGILSDGTVVPCCLDSCGNINLGNIFEKSIDEILNSEKVCLLIENFKNNKLTEPLCQKCDYRQNILNKTR